ncbi:hotdog family protein [Stutzerimonas chloritidismutans]|uniref:3-hydroxylacyl-ACP dehydratase n=1 Tax=Stutzerimonas chloritidismutans AW-1 TaxID=1263865 RepID=V4Q9J0_STUCH|nr:MULTISPECIES: hotdog family protein [Stutzerimonas stutzeri subgroup]MBU0565652.1 hotdog family protein [Gammaproteobacteria bacterium]ESQ98422.1 3-hydroxylacyl-ACP dehydratase [Stutzerimonas chloritidismutans AW-1]MBU1806455.1 hotdog family protein [Gammaproteobacteria bacterium]MBU2333847.1 hotdog family protein [Gammaproteobacteria bacterium]UIP32254.1 hotdog family protein [Stutzerimonas kunmingensis]
MIDWPIAELLPHAGDMILLDGVERFDDDSVETVLQVRADGLLSAADGSLPAWVGVEIMAQSVAAFAGCHARQAGQPVELGFLLGTRSYQCNVEAFPAGADLRVRAHRSLQDDNGMGVFECHLDGPGIHAEARLNVFRPPEVASYLQESAP